MVSKTIITDLTIEVELSTRNECLSLVNKITNLVTASDSEIVPVDTNILDTNKSIFTKKEIPIVLLCHSEFSNYEYPDFNVKKWYISVEFMEHEQYMSHSLLVEFIKLLKYYNLPYKLTKITFALDITLYDSFNSINIEKNSKIYPLKKAHGSIETEYTQVIRQQIIATNQLKLLITVQNTQFCLDHFIIEEVLQTIAFHIDNSKIVTPDYKLILNYLNTLFK